VPVLAAIVCGAAGWIFGGSLNRTLLRLFHWFNRGFQRVTRGYVRSVGWVLRGSLLTLAAYAGLMFGTVRIFESTPTGFIPPQDKGYLLVNVRLPDSSSLRRTQEVMTRLESLGGAAGGVKHTVAIAGQSVLLGANAPNFGTMYVMLDDFAKRIPGRLTADRIAAELRELFQRQVAEGDVNILGAPPIDGLGTAGGFKIVIEDRSDQGLAALESTSREVVQLSGERPALRDVFTSFRADTTWLFLDVDRDAVKALGVSMADVFQSLQVNFGSLYINDFNRFGRTWQVNVQADARFRMTPRDLKRLHIPGPSGQMIPLSSFAEIREVSGPVMLLRYNLYPSAAVNADAAVGTSSGDAIRELEQVAREAVGPGMRAEWTELALLQQNAGTTAVIAFVLAVALVFLVLAAQYESWALPLAVILVVPMCLLCSIAGVIAARMDINIFTQIGFVVLVGLACKNAILIVEFARARRMVGVPCREATLAACALRLRPIVMTSLAFIIGVIPLMVGQGAGAEMRRTLGTAVFAGMLGVTLFGIFLTPAFFYVIQSVVDWRSARSRSDVDELPPGTDPLPSIAHDRHGL